MTYISQSGCSSGACGTYSGTCGSGISGYSSGSAGPGYSSLSSIDSVISSYSGPIANAMESAVQQYQPMLFGTEPEQNVGNNAYSIAESIHSAAYGRIRAGYNPGKAGQSPSGSRNPVMDSFNPNTFLSRNRPASPFIGSSEDIKHYIKEAFEKTTGKLFPDDVIIRVVDQQELRQLHEEFGGQWSPGLQGVSINKKGFSQSLILVKENELDRLMVTIGHELGHVINFPLSDRHNEEAKAFAFEMEWLKAMYTHNIAGLRDSLDPDPCPARNGLHDVAFNFVKQQRITGKDYFDIIKDLMANRIKVRGDCDVWD